MEDQTTQNEVAQQGPPQASGFQSTSSRVKSSNSKWLIIFILLLVLGGAGIYFFSKTSSDPIATPTPSFGVVPIEEPKNTPTPTPTSTPTAVKKSSVSIEILNGTGITGEAKLLSDKLKTLGYSDITAGNADSTDNKITTVTFSKDLSQTIQDELKKELESFYKEVNLKTSTTQKSDVVIITGLRGTSTASPSASPSATPTN